MSETVPSAGPPGGDAADAPPFLHGGGQMGALMRAHDWSRSSLGPPSSWPQALRTAVRILLNTGHPMYLFWGPAHACLYNDAYSESIGPERHPVSLGQPGRHVWDEIWPVIGPQIEQVMAGRGATWHVNQLVPITRHGRRDDVYWTYSYSPIDDETSPTGVGGVLVVCTETTQQVLANQRLTVERDQLARLFEQAPTFMALLEGPEHRYVLTNAAYAALVHHRPVLGRTVAEALPEAARQGYVALLDRVYASGEAFIANGMPFVQAVGANGETVERFVDFVYQPIRDAAGRVGGVFVLGSDVTGRILTDAALRASLAREQEARTLADAASRAKDEFLAMLGHELRNPRAPIHNAVSIMRQIGPQDDDLNWCREVVERQATQLTRIVDDLLDVSRVSRGKIQLQVAPVQLADVMQHAEEVSRQLIDARGHQLSLSLPDEPLVVMGDLTRLTQIVANLLNNASKYGRGGGRIAVAARVDGHHVTLTVADDGAGIRADLLPRVFDLFEQDPRSADRAQGGLGIGLAIVKGLVTLHGGTVEAESAGPNRGSRFTVRLPAGRRQSRRDQASTGGDPVTAGGIQATASRVLIVDDNRDAANLLAEAVTHLGHQTAVAYDGPSALAMAVTFKPEIALLDLGLPVMDGYELAQRLEAAAGTGRLGLVAVTGYGQALDRQRSAAAGFHAHLAKPTPIDRIADVLEEMRRRGVPPPE